MSVKPNNEHLKNTALFLLMAGLLVATGLMQSWNSALLILNMGLVSAIMALGVNLQWGLAGLFNIGVMGFVALGGLAVALVSTELRPAAWAAGGLGILLALGLGAAAVIGAIWARRKLPPGRARGSRPLWALGGGGAEPLQRPQRERSMESCGVD